MSSETAICPRCDQSFLLRGYQSHLALSQDPLCRAVFDKLKKANDAYELLMNAEENSSSGADSDTDTVPFQGDAFGTAEDYASDMFGQTMDDNQVDADDPPPLMEVSDDEDDDEEDDEEELEMANMVAELEKSWEPPRQGAPRQEAIDGEVDADDPPPLMEVSDNEDDEEEAAPRQAVDNSDVIDERHTQFERKVDRLIIGDGYGVRPAVRIRYNDKHPSARAGQPLTHEESRDHVYGAALGGGDNPWAPFNSKKDWEIARWAKLRGAGSTAFSELLAIDGVCFN
jgi:hypothetical protein